MWEIKLNIEKIMETPLGPERDALIDELYNYLSRILHHSRSYLGFLNWLEQEKLSIIFQPDKPK